MPKVKTKSLGEQLFEIVEAESDENRRRPGFEPERWCKLKARQKRRYETIAERFAERIKQEEPSDD